MLSDFYKNLVKVRNNLINVNIDLDTLIDFAVMYEESELELNNLSNAYRNILNALKELDLAINETLKDGLADKNKRLTLKK